MPPSSKPLHTTFTVNRLKPTQKSLTKDTNTRSDDTKDDNTKTTRGWSGPIPPNEAEDSEISSNAIDGTQYEAKKNESK